MIFFDEKKQIFHLQTPNSSYMIGIYGGYILEHLYWGKRLETCDGVSGSPKKTASFSSIDAELLEQGLNASTETIPQEYSFYGSCDLRKPAFHAVYADGSRITKMKYVSHTIYSGKPKLCGLPSTYAESDSEADTLEITVKDELTGLELIYRYTAFNNYDAITRNTEVINNGTAAVSIDTVMSCNVDFSRADFDMVNLSGAWARERHIERRHLGTGTTKIESRRGASSHHQSPFFALCDKNADEKAGDVYGFSFVYSGNFEAGAEVDTYERTRAFMGINSCDFSWLLEPGETFTAPEVVMVYSDKGFGRMSRTFNKLYQKRLARGRYRDEERLVLINNWEGTYFDFDEEKIVNIAKSAKSAGIEMLVLDDGWFGKRDSDNCSLGDWYADTRKLPNGISGLVKKINDMGMKFGLWFEPEMVSPDSDLYRAHPDWCLHVEGRKRSEGRNQLILDFSRSDVREYIIKALKDVLDSAPIEYVKWDMNRNMSCVGSAKLPPNRQAETAHRYMLGLYSVLEEIITAYPNILFEGCSGGGGRFDAGMMYYFNQYWTSDDTDAAERMYIQHGTSLVMPSAFMGSHISAVPNHQVGRISPLKTRGYIAMCGQFGYELDVTKMTADELNEIKEQVEVYKSVREVIHNGDMYRLASPFESRNAAWEYVAEDKKTVVMFFFTVMTAPSQQMKYIKLDGLCADKLYRLRGTDEIYGGDVLMNRGICLADECDCGGQMLVFDLV